MKRRCPQDPTDPTPAARVAESRKCQGEGTGGTGAGSDSWFANKRGRGRGRARAYWRGRRGRAAPESTVD